MRTMQRAGFSARMGAHAALVAVVAALACGFPASASATPLAFSACSSHQELIPTPGVQCATLTVPQRPEDPGLGSLSLAVQRVPATGTQLGTIVFLSGGPGEAALPDFEGLLAPLAKRAALHGYELVSFDQRGTGESGALSCPALFRRGLSALGACGELLGAARADYTSQDSVEDLHALRVALGGPPLSLFGVSYGTKVAGMYALEYPQDVARMVLDSPVPIAGWDELDSQRARALPRVLDHELCGDGVCRSFAPDPDADLYEVVAKLRAHPVKARIFNTNGRRETVTVTEAGVYELMVYMDLSTDLAGLVPAAVADAAHDRWRPLARLTSELPPELPTAATAEEESNDLFSTPLLASTLCAETPLPWSPESAVASRGAAVERALAPLPSNDTAPFAPLTAANEAATGFCAKWPPTPAAPPPPTGSSSVPTLILSGDEDLRTSYEEDLSVAAGYTDAQILRIPDAGHSTVTSDRTGCAKRAMVSFLAGQPAPTSCPGASTGQTVPPPATSLGRVHPAGSRSKLAGRGAEAVADTLREILGQPTAAGAGLNGGAWAIKRRGFRLEHVSDIPGVAVSGYLSLAKVPLSGSFTVDGRAGGKLRLKNNTLSGRLAGSAVRLHLAL